MCQADPLLFMCELKDVALLRVKLPTGELEHVSVGDTAADMALPAGYTAKVLNITEKEVQKRNIFLILLIANASLLDGHEITCSDTTPSNVVMAGCPLRGTFLKTLHNKG